MLPFFLFLPRSDLVCEPDAYCTVLRPVLHTPYSVQGWNIIQSSILPSCRLATARATWHRTDGWSGENVHLACIIEYLLLLQSLCLMSASDDRSSWVRNIGHDHQPCHILAMIDIKVAKVLLPPSSSLLFTHSEDDDAGHVSQLICLE